MAAASLALRGPAAAQTHTILPSLLAADPLRLADEVASLREAGVTAMHVDVMDGHFVDNLAFAPSQVRALRGSFEDVYFDVHLMVEWPLKWAKAFAEAGASAITCHFEALADVPAALLALRQWPVARGLSLRPQTPLADVWAACGGQVAALDVLLVMGVEPGFGGQKLLNGTLAKVAEARAWRADNDAHFAIVVDGGVTLENIAEVAAAGADAMVVGTDLMRHCPYAERLGAYRAALRRRSRPTGTTPASA